MGNQLKNKIKKQQKKHDIQNRILGRNSQSSFQSNNLRRV